MFRIPSPARAGRFARNLAIAALALAAAIPAQAQAPQGGIDTGRLTCIINPSIGFIIGSRRHLNCNYKPLNGATVTYVGTITRLGLDIGITEKSILVWRVFAAQNVIDPSLLVGKYVGFSGQVQWGVGVGANALVGGNANSVVLSPLSVEGDTGIGIAAGVAELELETGP